eukprot:TRINITY_DN2949_c0_g1_i2.p1 TRINITY_DN2949_c0_g1~~TRINITY_DN2949_c0_g1_i2.p1  ORF type:complete len:508 (-),score=74.94 TRINITY_DN2949_c0_g1_i2:38-1561(-)
MFGSPGGPPNVGRWAAASGSRNLSSVLLLFVLIILCSLATPTVAEVVDTSVHTPFRFIPLYKFGFLAGGSMDVEITVKKEGTSSNGWYYFFVCEQGEFLKSYHTYSTAQHEDRCLATFTDKSIHFVANTTFHDHLRTSVDTISRSGEYYLMMMNCQGGKLDIKGHFVLLNPDGEHLSSGNIPLPKGYFFLVLAWSVLGVLWLCNWGWHLRGRYVIPLHVAMTCVIAVRFAWVYFNLRYWNYWSETGTLPTAMEVAYYVLMAASGFVFFVALLLFAKGYSITRSSLSGAEIRAIFLTAAGLQLCIIFYHLLGGHYLFALVLMTIIVLKFIGYSLSRNIGLLNDQFHAIAVEYSREEAYRTPIYAKLCLFWYFQLAIITYVVGCVVQLGAVVMVSNSPWVMHMVGEIDVLVVTCAMCWLLRLRTFGPRPDGDGGEEEEEEIEGSSTSRMAQHIEGFYEEARKLFIVPPDFTTRVPTMKKKPLVVTIQTPTHKSIGSMYTFMPPVSDNRD